MSRLPSKRIVSVAVFLGVVASVFAWRTSRLSTGWDWQQRCWVLLTRSRFAADKPDPIGESSSKQLQACRLKLMQSDGWQSNPRLASGGAWILCGPLHSLVSNAQFEKAWSALEAATRLEPNNPLWWRSKALLLFPWDAVHESPRRSDWPRVLKECQQHDPDNALYDYLAALGWWSQSTTVDYGYNRELQEPRTEIKIRDQANHERSLQHWKLALTKPKMTFFTDQSRVIMEAGQWVGLSDFDCLTIADRFRYFPQAESLLSDNVTVWSAVAEVQLRAKDFAGLKRIGERFLTLARQLEAAPQPDLDQARMAELTGLMTISQAVKGDKSLLTYKEIQRYDRRLRELNAGWTNLSSSPLSGSPLVLWQTILVSAACQSLLVLVPLTLLAMLVARCLRRWRADGRRISLGVGFLCLLFAFCLSAFRDGIAPNETLSVWLQHYGVGLLLLAAALPFAAISLIAARRNGIGLAQVGSLLVFVLAAAIMVGLKTRPGVAYELLLSWTVWVHRDLLLVAALAGLLLVTFALLQIFKLRSEDPKKVLRVLVATGLPAILIVLSVASLLSDGDEPDADAAAIRVQELLFADDSASTEKPTWLRAGLNWLDGRGFDTVPIVFLTTMFLSTLALWSLQPPTANRITSSVSAVVAQLSHQLARICIVWVFLLVTIYLALSPFAAARAQQNVEIDRQKMKLHESSKVREQRKTEVAKV